MVRSILINSVSASFSHGGILLLAPTTTQTLKLRFFTGTVRTGDKKNKILSYEAIGYPRMDFRTNLEDCASRVLMRRASPVLTGF